MLATPGLSCSAARQGPPSSGSNPRLRRQLRSSPLSHRGSQESLHVDFQQPALFIVGEGDCGGGGLSAETVGLGERGEQVGAPFPQLESSCLGASVQRCLSLDLGPGVVLTHSLSEACARGCSRLLIAAAPALHAGSLTAQSSEELAVNVLRAPFGQHVALILISSLVYPPIPAPHPALLFLFHLPYFTSFLPLFLLLSFIPWTPFWDTFL